MKERGIPFSPAMALAAREHRKTQTRRILNGVPEYFRTGDIAPIVNGDKTRWCISRIGGPQGSQVWGGDDGIACPYGVVGDRLWVREAWRLPREYDEHAGGLLNPDVIGNGIRGAIWYEADGRWPWATRKPGRYRHARFMPRWAARTVLEINAIGIERLQDITPNDAQAEGIVYEDERPHDVRRIERCPLVDGYMRLWEELHGEGAWDENPWVWVITFARIDTPF
jgi:hypothetical protein